MRHYYSNQQAVPLALEWFDYRPLLYAFLVLALFLFGMKPSLGQTAPNDAWKLHSTSGKVSVYYKFSKCEQQDVVLLKFQNAGNAAVEATWNEKLSLRGHEVYTTAAPKKLLLPVGETAASACAAADASLLVTPAYKYVSLLRPGLTSFDIYDLVITTRN